MTDRWLTWLNCLLLSLTAVLGLVGAVFWFKQTDEIACSGVNSKECNLPKAAFELPESAYHEAGELLLALQQAPPAMQLPDLKTHLIYYGKNGRPDAQTERPLLHFSISGNNKHVVSIAPQEKLYIVHDKSSKQGRYAFSPNNEKSSLWISAIPIDNEVQVHVTMENEKGERVSEPDTLALFRLPEKEYARYGGVPWEIGSTRVDGTLLARQKARWCGGDRFLEKHGGEEYKEIEGKQRIDFGENDDLYSVFVKVGDCLAWNGKQWKSSLAGEETQNHPLLVVKKVDEKLIAFELWDTEGKGKVSLNLLKTTEPWAVQNAQTLQHMFKFLGARTRTQCVFEINRERVILRPSDWMLLTPKGWKKLTTEEEIDCYVKRKTTGTLFVFEGIERKDEKQMMIGTIYSPSRHESQPVEMALVVKGAKTSKDPKDKAKETVETSQAAIQARAREAAQRSAGAPTDQTLKK